MYLARAIADHPAAATPSPRHPSSVPALIVVAVVVLSWGRHLTMWLDRSPSPYRDQAQQFEDRVAARNAFVFVFVQ